MPPTAHRIDAAFADLRQRGAKAFVAFVTAGLPDPAGHIALLKALEQQGVTLVELGVPYSDPIADGPVIQASFQQALQRGVTWPAITDLVTQARAEGLSLPLSAMVSYAIVHRVGPARFLTQAAAAGFDGLIVPDLPVDECDDLADLADAAGLRLTLLSAPTTSPARQARIAAHSRGFVYCLSVAGVTGERLGDLPDSLAGQVAALKALTDTPVCVGFGLSRPAQVAAAAALADGVIVGSALVRRLAEAHDRGPRAAIDEVSALVAELMAALPAPTSPSLLGGHRP